MALLILVAVASLAAEAVEPDEFWPPRAEERAEEIYQDLGNLSFPLPTNVSKSTQQYFDQGFRLLAAFDFRRAVLSFRTAAAADASCALCAWGEALALGPNLNSFDEPRLLASIPAAFQRAQDAADLLERQVSPNPLEVGLIRAMQKRYLPSTAEYVRAEAGLTQAYAQAMEQLLSELSPADVNYANVVALTADALMNTHPWDYWVPSAGGKQLRPEAQRAMKMLDQALRPDPLQTHASPRDAPHAFCVHLLVHVTEASGNRSLLDEVRPMAEVLPKLMPGAPHLIHMSFHTLMHTGDFHQADGDNTRASELPRQIYPMHNLDTLSWVCRIQGRSSCAFDAAQSLQHLALPLVGTGIFETGFPPARFAAVWPLTLVAFGRYRQVLTSRAPEKCEVDPFLAGIWHFARGAAAAHLDLPQRATQELRLLQRKRLEVKQGMAQPTDLAWKNFNGSKAWAVYPALALLELAEAELLGRMGSLAAWHRAWALEVELPAALPYDEPPSWYLPVANRFGAALLDSGHLDEAKDVYSNSLSRLPRNGWVMMGLWQWCQRKHGDKNESACHELHENFTKAWRYADVVLKNSGEVQGPSSVSAWWAPASPGPSLVAAVLLVALAPLAVLRRCSLGHGARCWRYHRMDDGA